MQISAYFRAVNDRIRQLIESGRTPELEEILTTGAQAIIEEAYETKEPGNETFNQADAYYWALFFNGELIDQSFLGEAIAPIQSGHIYDKDTGMWEEYPGQRLHYWGRAEAIKAIANITPVQYGYTLVIGNAMYYSRIQERGVQYGRDDEEMRYPVLSQVSDKIQALANVRLKDGRQINGLATFVNMTA